MKPKISVVIPAHNRPDFLENTIKALLAQSLKEFELLVVGYKGNETIPRVRKKFSDKRIRFFRISSRFPDKKRNFGIRKARAGIVAFTDDDCLPEKDWLKNMYAAFGKDKALAGIEGLTWNDNKRLYFHATENLAGGKYPACNYAFRKKWLEKVGGFDEDYNFFREDTDLAFKVLKKGGRVEFRRDVRVFHPPRKLKLYQPARELKYLKGDVRLFKKFPKLYRKHFGLLCRGPIKQSLFAGAIIWVLTFAVFNAVLWLLALAVAVEWLFKYFVEMRGKKFSAFEGIAFPLFSFLRDLLFGYVFIYLLFVRGRIRRLDNLFDRFASLS